MNFRQITMDEAVKAFTEMKNCKIVDVRRPDEFMEGHIPAAMNIPNESILECPLELPDKNQLIFVYCRSGKRSLEACHKLVNLGYTQIVDIGGILDYKGEIER